MPDYDAWDLTSDFTVAQASCLWCEVDSDISFHYQKSKNPRIAAIEQMLVSEIRAGRLRADSTQNFMASIGDYATSLVSRDALIELAERKGLAPKFLFPAARQPSSQAQASALLAPREGSTSAHDKSTSPLGQSVEGGKVTADPQGRGGLTVADDDVGRLADIYLEGRRILDELVEARTVEEAMRAVGREIAWRNAMLPVVERVFSPVDRARLYILHELEPEETERVADVSAFNRDHAQSMVCHDARLYRLGKKLDGLDSAWGKNIGRPARRGRKPGSGTTPNDPLIAEALQIANTKEASSDWAEADPDRTGFPGRPPKAKHLIEQEFQRRVDAGEVCSTLTEEVGALLEWLRGEHPSAPRPTPKTIKNNIRDSYRRYEQKQRPTAQ